jgi:hypothetical protein
LVAILLFLSIAPAFAQSTRPITGPAPAPTPKEALTRLSAGLHDGDAAAIVALVDIPTGPAGKVATAMARFDAALADLHRACVERFGKEKAVAVIGDIGLAAEQSQSAIDSASVRIDGDKATVSFSDQTAAHLVKVGDGWKVKLDELEADDLAGNADASAEVFDHLSVAAHALATDIRQQKFKNADKAAEAWHNQMMQAVADTQPASQPAP